MNKRKLAICICGLVLVLTVGILWPGESREVNKEALKPFVGEWDCQESPLEERGSEDYTYVGYFDLRVEEDGSFSMYDAEAGNPGISGMMYPETDGSVQLDCDTDDFDPPFCWTGIKKDSILQASFGEENGIEVLYLAYTNEAGEVYTLVFERWK